MVGCIIIPLGISHNKLFGFYRKNKHWEIKEISLFLVKCFMNMGPGVWMMYTKLMCDDIPKVQCSSMGSFYIAVNSLKDDYLFTTVFGYKPLL